MTADHEYIRGLKASYQTDADLEEAAREAIALHPTRGADGLRKAMAECLTAPNFHHNAKHLANRLDRLGRSDIAKVILEAMS
jgi:hypothetical protein